MKKYFLYFLGLNLIAFAVVLNVRFDLGVAAFSSVMYSISQIYNISLGTASIICFIMTMFITAMGVFLSVKTNLILTPTDGIVKTISEVFSFPFSIVKNTFDITLVFVTIILCLINHTHFYGLGIGTILTALFIGRIINIYEKKIQLSF